MELKTRDEITYNETIESTIINTEPIITYNENINSTILIDTSKEILEKKTNGNYDTLVLSGGGCKGISILGSIQYMKDNEYLNNINIYIGTSVGSIICYLLSIGYNPTEIISYICTNQILEKIQFLDIVSMINGGGASSFSFIQEHLERMTVDKIGRYITMKDLYTQFNKKLICCTYNLTTESTEYICYENHPDMPCLVALRLSSNLPFIFDKYKYQNNFYIDGGVSNNFPIDIGDKLGNKVIGIYINEHNENNEDKNLNILEYFYKLILIPVIKNIKSKIKSLSSKCTILSINTENIGMFQFDISTTTKLNMFSNGYTQTSIIFDKLNI